MPVFFCLFSQTKSVSKQLACEANEPDLKAVVPIPPLGSSLIGPLCALTLLAEQRSISTEFKLDRRMLISVLLSKPLRTVTIFHLYGVSSLLFSSRRELIAVPGYCTARYSPTVSFDIPGLTHSRAVVIRGGPPRLSRLLRSGVSPPNSDI